MEKVDDIQGSGNTLDFGARILDTRLGRFLSIDALYNHAPFNSPYILSGNTPIYCIDINGNFKIEISEAVKTKYGLTEEKIIKFTHILQNVSKLVSSNPQLLDLLCRETGYDKEKVLKDLQWGNGPTFYIDDNLIYGMQTSKSAWENQRILVNAPALLRLENMKEDDNLNNEYYGAWALSVLHEYTHYGDRDQNNGSLSGEFNLDPGLKRIPDIREGELIEKGTQPMSVSYSGHRGSDIEIMEFNVKISMDPNGIIGVTRNMRREDDWAKLSLSKRTYANFENIKDTMSK